MQDWVFRLASQPHWEVCILYVPTTNCSFSMPLPLNSRYPWLASQKLWTILNWWKPFKISMAYRIFQLKRRLFWMKVTYDFVNQTKMNNLIVPSFCNRWRLTKIPKMTCMRNKSHSILNAMIFLKHVKSCGLSQGHNIACELCVQL